MYTSPFVLILFLGMVLISIWPVSGTEQYVPIPTRPPYVHEYLCSSETELNISPVLVSLVPGNSYTDSGMNVTVGEPGLSAEVNRTDIEFGPDGKLRIEQFIPGDGCVFLIIPVQISNVGDDEICFDLTRIELTDSNTGLVYPVDDVMDFLPDPFHGRTIPPGDEQKGNVVYQVPVQSSYELLIMLKNYRVIYGITLKKNQQ